MENIRLLLKKYWGYDSFRPLQQEAMECVMKGRDSIVVLPTGGGKSLCFQAPAVAMPGFAIVISPLISLMKDQVDGLTDCGIPAACINSALTSEERDAVGGRIRHGELKLLYVAPERMVLPSFIEYMKRQQISFIAVDEAHCISSWGHDFRPEYRGLSLLKESFPNVAIHAYTATATEHVRRDIIQQLRLSDPGKLVGSFDRPNLIYSVQTRKKYFSQVTSVVDRHPSESGIIYCISRKKVEDLCEELNANGYRALPYHAGMADQDRKKNQEAFIQEDTDIIVATVAFGMGIDKSNVRYVIHNGMPKSLEHYMQESGRAGRDGLEADCSLIYSTGDFMLWKKLLADLEADAYRVALRQLEKMLNYCEGYKCRHQTLVEYFGQRFEKGECEACDNCLDSLPVAAVQTRMRPVTRPFVPKPAKQEVRVLVRPEDHVPSDAALIASQKILSCVVRLAESATAESTASVLTGDEKARANGHDKLSTWNIMDEEDGRRVRRWIEKLTHLGCLESRAGSNVLAVTPEGWQVIKGARTPPLFETSFVGQSADPWDGVDRSLFDRLRELRREIAKEKEVAAFVVFSDASLREMARFRPRSLDAFRRIKGVGDKKAAVYGETFMRAIAAPVS